jgi:hypothetical protein
MNLNLKRTAFFLRAYNDVDQISPLIAEFVLNNENPLVVITSDIDLENDYRFNYLKGLGDIEIVKNLDKEHVKFSQKDNIFRKLLNRLYLLKRSRKSILGKIFRYFFFDCKDQVEFLKLKNIGVCVFEAGSPFERGVIREKYFFAAKGTGITTIALPHGCNLFLNPDVTIGYRKLVYKGEVQDQSDRNLFDYYIIQNPIRRDGWIKWGYDSVKTQAWGSLRFFPEWAAKNKEICPKFNFEGKSNGKTKIVFMQFQQEYNLKNDLIFETLKKISFLKDALLIVKDTTREGKEYGQDYKNKKNKIFGQSLVGWHGNEVHSPALIDWADVVIVVGGSSIGMEVILQNKILINPVYLDTNTTLYEFFEAAHCPNSFEELENFLRLVIEKKPIPKLPGTNKIIKEIVYAGKENFNVPKKHYQQLNEINLNYGKTIK